MSTASESARESIDAEVERAARRRRTFAIIAHPDAGKTTLTERFLLEAGAIEVAGMVRARKGRRHATSDWMAMEQERGISMTTSVLQFEHGGCILNLLDTPGHQDFSEDTYRTLLAVDSAIMVLDAAKGIEEQTRKLFVVCRQRRIPLLTFINKFDQPGRDPLSLLDEIQKSLHIEAVPVTWPVGAGPDFAALFHRRDESLWGPSGNRLEGGDLRPAIWNEAQEHLSLLDSVGLSLDKKRFLAAEQTPVFFGSALKGIGVPALLDAIVDLAPGPRARQSNLGPIDPATREFSGLVFKIQANMDPRHGDRVAFIRICSGKFTKDMLLYHPKLQRRIRAARPHRFFAGSREGIQDAYPGDVIGLVNPGLFRLGDTVTEGTPLSFGSIPSFPPEQVAILRSREAVRRKQLLQGLAQLQEEGVLQLLRPLDDSTGSAMAAVVGPLQMDLVQSRLLAEYRVETEKSILSFTVARWIHGDGDISGLRLPNHRTMLVRDQSDQLMLLCESEWDLGTIVRDNPSFTFDTAPDISFKDNDAE
jgi:peptide chain release factor 3